MHKTASNEATAAATPMLPQLLAVCLPACLLARSLNIYG